MEVDGCIDDRIQYVDCQPGDGIGILQCTVEARVGRNLTKTVKWDSVHRTEFEALQQMKEFISIYG